MHDSRGEGSAPPRRITDHVVYQNKNRDSYNQGHDVEIPSGSHRRACPPVCQRWVACKIQNPTPANNRMPAATTITQIEAARATNHALIGEDIPYATRLS